MTMRGAILLTGGAGFIGSHVAVEVAAAGWQPVILDNFCTSERSVVSRVGELVGAPVRCIEADIRDAPSMRAAFGSTPIHAVIHLAGLKAVGESVEKPALYHDNNVRGTEVLLAAMDEFGVRRMVFSSSCTVYGTPQRLPSRIPWARSIRTGRRSSTSNACSTSGPTRARIAMSVRCATSIRWERTPAPASARAPSAFPTT
jgi:UDP-glucose 4-epimerase